MAQLGAFEYTIMAVYLVGVVALGLCFSGKQKSLSEYFLASGTMPWWAVSISLYATALSPLSFLGASGWMIAKDPRWPLGTAVIGIATTVLAALIWVPIWGRLRLLTIFEYLERRYHPAIRSFGAAMFPIEMMFWIGTALVTAAMAFNQVTGVPTHWCIVGIVLLGTLYTVLGGARAVVWTDVAQFGVFCFAYAAIGFMILQYFNWDASHIYHVVSQMTSPVTGQRQTTLVSTEFSLAIEATIWCILFVMITEAVKFGGSQVYIQRLLATNTRGKMFKALIGQSVVGLIWVLMTIGIAWGLLAFYTDHPQAVRPEHADKVMAGFVVEFLPAIVRGIVMTGLLAAMMSTFDSALNSISSVAINDFYKRYVKHDADQHHYVIVSRVITLVAGLFLLAFALWQLKNADATGLERVGRLNVLIAPAIIPFFVLGIFSKRANTFGVLIGSLSGIAVAVLFNGFPGLFRAVIFGDDALYFHGSVNWLWLGGFGMVTGFVVGYFASFLFPPPSQHALRGLTIAEPLPEAEVAAQIEKIQTDANTNA
jgi:SSS family transporter